MKWPVTYKFVRKGDLFTASVFFDRGKKFLSIKAGDKLDTSKVKLKDPVIVGIAINGHNSVATTGTATVTDIFLDGSDTFTVEVKDKLTVV